MKIKYGDHGDECNDSFYEVKMSAMNTRIKNLIVLLIMVLPVFNMGYCYAVSVGDPHGGGTVYCVSKISNISKCVTDKGASGDYGLIMANKDQSNYDSNPKHGITWSNEYKIVGPNAQSLDDGRTNTQTIVNAYPKNNKDNNAAWLCYYYKDEIEGHTDWYLPSINELNKMYLYAKANNLIGKNCSGSKSGGVQCLVGGYSDKMYYWSSSEYPGTYGYGAWCQVFNVGDQNFNCKIVIPSAVRAIRNF